ncbi:creatininase family protein [Thermophilibacter sp.]|uniref:creatininase family protein n=1 Tax=Thermophilibacter sp. TaxID=2847309 RepID=UPI003A92B2B4
MRLERSTWPQVRSYFAEHDVVLLPFGSIEQHGRHNPLGTDLFAPLKLADLIEERLPDLLIAPALPFGSTPRFAEFPGTVDLGDELLRQVALRVCESLMSHGARHFVLLNGHGGNSKALGAAQLELARRGCRCAELDWWRMVRDIRPEWAGGHGGAQETSANLCIDPSLVDTGALAGEGLVDDLGPELPTTYFDTVRFKGVDVCVPRPTSEYAENGWMGDDNPREASAEWGRQMLSAVADWAAEFIPAFARTPLPMPA